MKLLVQIVCPSWHLISLKDEIYLNLADLFNLFFRSVILLSILKRDHPFSTYQKLSGKLKFLTPDRHTYICVLRDKKFMFSENFAYVPDGWPQTPKTAKNCSSFQKRWISNCHQVSLSSNIDKILETLTSPGLCTVLTKKNILLQLKVH